MFNDVNIAAGCLVTAQASGRFLLGLRDNSAYKNHWNLFGGTKEPNETPLDAALREFKEETKYKGKIVSIKFLYRFINHIIIYYSYLVIVPNEFKPSLNNEHITSGWFEPSKLPSPLHPGLKILLQEVDAENLLRKRLDL